MSALLGLVFFGFAAPLFSAISQTWLGFGGGGNCGCGFGGARSEEEDEVEKVGMGTAAALLYRVRPTVPHSRVFWEPFPRSAPLRFLRCGKWAINLAFAQTAAHGAHLSVPSVAPRRNIANISAIY